MGIESRCQVVLVGTVSENAQLSPSPVVDLLLVVDDGVKYSATGYMYYRRQ